MVRIAARDNEMALMAVKDHIVKTPFWLKLVWEISDQKVHYLPYRGWPNGIDKCRSRPVVDILINSAAGFVASD